VELHEACEQLETWFFDFDRGHLGRNIALLTHGGASMKTFRTLELAIQFNDLASEVKPAAHLRDQLLRAASSLALNLAEGNAKASERDKKRFYQMAYGSLRECQTIFRLAHIQDAKLDGLTDHLAASIYKLIQSKIIKEKVGVPDDGSVY
jgi:four helix bundle protein